MVTSDPPAPVFSVTGLRLRFPGETGPIFEALDWELGTGSRWAVLGPSGAGKTLLMKVMTGLVRPDAGRIRYEGRELGALRGAELRQFRSQVGMTFQRSGLFDSLSCGENLEFALREVLGLNRRELRSRIGRALEEVGLGGQERLQIHEMSGGMQKRLGIARALLLSPRVIFYDEPTAGLDPLTARAIDDLIDEVCARYAMTIVVVTSDPREAYRLCDHLAFLYRGRLAPQGPIAEMRRSQDPALHQFLRGSAQGPLTEGLA